MQKLIDELELFPAQDAIPNQLAEKIVPTFQVNAQEILFSPPVAKIVRTSALAGGNTQTIYTTPATGNFYLTNVILDSCPNNTLADAALVECYITITIDGSTQSLLRHILNNDNANYYQQGKTNTINLQNPILVDKGTNITVTAPAAAAAYGTIIGYILTD